MTRPSPPVLEYRRPDLRSPRRRASLGLSLFELSLLASVYIAYATVADRGKPYLLFFWTGFLIWIAILAIALIARRARHPQFVRGANVIRAIGCVFIALLIWLGFTFRFNYYVCPHGQTWSNNIIGLCKSPSGGPCGNVTRNPHSGVIHFGGEWYLILPGAC